MSFSRAPLKRFNDSNPETPGPDAYDPKLLEGKKGGAPVKSKRFQEIKEETPGPGQYAPDLSASMKKRLIPPGNGALNLSTCSTTSEVFRTPVWKGTISRLPMLSKSTLSRRPKTSSASSVNSALSLDSFEVNNELKEKCKSLEAEIAALKSRLQQKSDKSESEKVIEGLKNEISDQKQALDTKLEALQKAEDERDELEEKRRRLEEDQENHTQRILSLQKELELLAQDNKTLEETVEENRRRLLEEQKSLEEKSTFLHFTQEQLNAQVEEKAALVQQLETESEKLKEEVSSLSNQLEMEKEKNAEIMSVYQLENQETMEEFAKKEKKIEKLLAEKFALISRANLADSDNARLQDENIALLGAQNDFRLKIENGEALYETILEDLKDVKSDLEVATNDKIALEEEYARLEKSKVGIELDLAQLVTEKGELAEKLDLSEAEKKKLQDLQASMNQTIESQNYEAKEMKNQIQSLEEELEEKTQLVTLLQWDKKELEMKTLSLEGSLSASYEDLKKSADQLEKLRLEIEEQKSLKSDLNETCLILEKRLNEANMANADLTSAKESEKQEMLMKLETLNLERTKIVEMNEELSAQVTENLDTIENLQISEQSLTELVQTLKVELEEKTVGMQSESCQLISAKEEVMNLTAAKKIIEEDLVVSKNEMEQLKFTLARMETDLSNANSEKDNSLNEVALLKQNLNEKEAKMVKLQRNVQDNEKVVADLEKKHRVELESRNKKIDQLREDVAIFDKVITRSNEMEAMLEEFLADNTELKEKLKVAKEDCEKYQNQYETLQAQIEPFRKQLDAFEAEKMKLEELNKANESSLKSLAEQHGKMLGHQNHKQKINYLVKIKQDNVNLAQENIKLQAQIKQMTVKIARLEGRDKSNKENRSKLATATASAQVNKTPTKNASQEEARRHTMAASAASPLAPKNK